MIALAVGVLLLLLPSVAAAQSAWCKSNPAACVCSDTLQSTTYTRVAAQSGVHAAFLGDQVGTKPCFFGDFVNANSSIEWSYGRGDTLNSMVSVSTDPAVLAKLPTRDLNQVARFLRSIDGFGGALRFGHTKIPLAALGSKRVELRWYSYHAPNYQWAGEGSCTNGKIAHSSAGYFAYPMMTLTLHGPGAVNTSLYTFIAPGYGWLWSGKTNWEGFTGGSGPRAGAGAGGATYRGNWTRHSIVVVNPRAADTGYDLRYYVKNVTTGSAEVEDVRFSAGCKGCMPTGGPDFTWSNTIKPASDMVSLHTEFYRAGGCTGWQGWAYVDMASWSTDEGQRIPPATEVEGGTAPAPVTYTLTTATVGAGAVSGAGSYPSGTAVSPVASPAAGSTFSAWSGDCSGSGACSVTMSANKTVTATFATETAPPPLLPPPPQTPTVTTGSTDATGVTFNVSWTAVPTASSYSYTSGLNDGSANQQGTVPSTTLLLKTPYMKDGQAGGGFVCIKSVNAAGASVDAACNALQVPAATVTPPSLPTGTLTVDTSVTRCNYFLTAVAPDATGGWVAQFYRDGATKVGNPITAAPYKRSVELFAPSHSFTVEFTKTGTTKRSPAAVTRVCP